MTAINLTKSNRAVGLLNEVAELIDGETNSLELHRIYRSLQSLMTEARTRVEVVERSTKDIAKETRSQTVAREPASARIAALCARI